VGPNNAAMERSSSTEPAPPRAQTPRTAAIYGGGIAGLTAAHELAARGWRVTVLEANPDAGGFFRSLRRDGDNLPSEYSWHGFGPWYHNVFDLLRQIPHADGGTLYERVLSRPIDFGIAPDEGHAQFDDTGPVPDVRRMFRMTRLDRLRWAWLMLKTWTAGQRSRHDYAAVNAAQAWGKVMTPVAASTWAASFGPWIGSDWTRVSLHQAGLFFCRQLTTQPPHRHAADAEGPAWWHGARSGWLLLRGPSSEAWFQPWVAHLRTLGVQFRFGERLHRLEHAHGRITAGWLESGGRVDADAHVLATNPYAAADILRRTPGLADLPTLQNFKPLTADPPHVQVSFRIAFAEQIRWPRPRCALVIADSEFNLTMFAEEQVWPGSVHLGDGVASLWTVTACVSRVPGRLHGLSVEHCTREQFIDEARHQLLRCGALDTLVREANDGRPLASFAVRRVEIWPELDFAPEGIRDRQPKWVNTTMTQPWLPDQRTPLANLLLAGAHTCTAADVWSIEAAVESGRRAARLLEPDVVVLPQYRPWPLRLLGALDDVLYRVHGPHVLVVLAVVAVLLLGGLAVLWWG
jgi:hypothetical protein